MYKFLLSLFLVLALVGISQAQHHHGYHGAPPAHRYYQNYSHYYSYPRPYYQPYYYVNPYPQVYINPFPQTYFNGPYIYQPNGMVFMWVNGTLIRVR